MKNLSYGLIFGVITFFCLEYYRSSNKSDEISGHLLLMHTSIEKDSNFLRMDINNGCGDKELIITSSYFLSIEESEVLLCLKK